MLVYAIFGPLVLALVVAWTQHRYYLWRVHSGRLPDEERPFFGILLFRGLLVALAVVLLVVISLKRQIPLMEDDPALTPERRQALIEEKYGTPEEQGRHQRPGEHDAELERAMAGDEAADAVSGSSQEPEPAIGEGSDQPQGD